MIAVENLNNEIRAYYRNQFIDDAGNLVELEKNDEGTNLHSGIMI